MTVEALIQELQDLDPSEDVPLHLAVAATGWDASYLLAALEQLETAGAVFGRPLDPEVEEVLTSLSKVL